LIRDKENLQKVLPVASVTYILVDEHEVLLHSVPLAHCVLRSASSPPCTIGNKFCLFGRLWAAMQRSSQRTVLQMDSCKTHYISPDIRRFPVEQGWASKNIAMECEHLLRTKIGLQTSSSRSGWPLGPGHRCLQERRTEGTILINFRGHFKEICIHSITSDWAKDTPCWTFWQSQTLTDVRETAVRKHTKHK